MKELKEVEIRLKRLSHKYSPGRWKPDSYVGREGTQFKFLNLKVPHIRQARKEGYSFSEKGFRKEWSVWNKIWKKTSCYEAALSALHFVNESSTEDLWSVQDELFSWQYRIDNWAHSDELSNCYSRLLEYKRSEVFPRFEKWHQSSNPWEVRQSLVGLLFYSRFREKVLPHSKILKFVKAHLGHQHYYVQKAVGWTLRECWNVYPDQTYRFLMQHAADIPSGGWTAATEKLSSSEKAPLSKIRKASQNKSRS